MLHDKLNNTWGNMGVSGVRWKPQKSDIMDALQQAKGVVTQAAKMLGVQRTTLSEYIKNNPDIKPLLEEMRYHFEEELLDASEQLLRACVGQRDDLSAALKAAFYYLNNKGKKRGYAHPRVQDGELTEAQSAFHGIMMQKEAERRKEIEIQIDTERDLKREPIGEFEGISEDANT